MFVFSLLTTTFYRGETFVSTALNVYQTIAKLGTCFILALGWSWDSRQLRIEYPGAIYHVMDRGDRNEDIFVDDVDRQDLLKTLAEACQKTGWQVHAYCLMWNHFHMVLETPHSKIVVFFAALASFA